MIWDHAPAHTNGPVQDFLRAAAAWLITELIPGGLTSVLQVCDLIINKSFKQFIQNLYYQWRREYIRAKKAAGVSGKLNIKLPRDQMIGFIEQSVKKINRNQMMKPTIRTTFQRVGQDPNVDCTDLFKAHLDSIAEGSMYRTILNAQTPLNLE